METKTNVMRLLEKQKINYIPHFYPHGDDIPTDGVTVAEFLGKEHLDLKKAAKAVKEKSIEMIKQNELLPLTGYVHGGCSPIGMKKSFKTTFHEDINSLETVTLSAGRIGSQIEISPADKQPILLLNNKAAAEFLFPLLFLF